MLQLERVFSVEEDVLPLLPPQDSKASSLTAEEVASALDAMHMNEDQSVNLFANYREPHRWESTAGSKANNETLNPLSERNIKLVGQERGGVLIFAWDGYEKAGDAKKTFIELYSIHEKRRMLIYTHPTRITVVHASVNKERTLLVFTTYARYARPDDPDNFDDIYHTSLVEIQPQNRLFDLGQPSAKLQRVIFLDLDAAGVRTKQTKTVYYMLFIVHKVHILLYSLPMAHVKAYPKSCWRVTGQPIKEYDIAKRFTWAQWDMNSQTLSYVCLRANVKETQQRGEVALRRVLFLEDGRQEITLDVTLPPRFGRHQMEDFEYMHLPCSRTVHEANSHMELVRVDNNALCLCLQWLDDSSTSRNINISVFLIYSRCKVDFVIPMSSASPSAVALTQVFFTTLNHMLVIYLPGHYLQLLDCSSDHDPCHSFSALGPDRVPPLPGQDESGDSAVFLTHIESIPNVVLEADSPASAMAVGGFGFAMFDSRTDTAYRYRFDEKALLDMFVKTPPGIAHVQAMHLALAHLQDPQLVLRIVRTLCDTQPRTVTADLLKEFLIGTTYMSIRSLKTDAGFKVDAEYLRLLPVTTLASIVDELEERRRPAERATSMQTVGEEQYRPFNIRAGQRFSFELMLGPPSLLSKAVHAQPSGLASSFLGSPRWRNRFDNVLSRVFGSPSPDPSTTRKRSGNDDVDDDNRLRQRFLDVLTHFTSTFVSKDVRPRCAGYSAEYARCQFAQAAQLWGCIDDTEGLPNIHQLLREHRQGASMQQYLPMFQLLESMYCAIEELYYPFPDSYHSKFAVLGFHVLPRHVYIQYVERGVFRMTEAVIEHIVVQVLGEATTEADQHFKWLLLSRVRSRKIFEKMLRKIPDAATKVVELAIASHLGNSFDVEDEDDGEPESADLTDDQLDAATKEQVDLDEPSFIPLSVFLQHLRNKGIRASELTHASRTLAHSFEPSASFEALRAGSDPGMLRNGSSPSSELLAAHRATAPRAGAV